MGKINEERKAKEVLKQVKYEDLLSRLSCNKDFVKAVETELKEKEEENGRTEQ